MGQRTNGNFVCDSGGIKVFVKKLGKAGIDLEEEVWTVPNSRETFLMNRRLIDTRPDIKVAAKRYQKSAQKKKPSFRDTEKRKEYFKEKDELAREFKSCLKKVYGEISEESFRFPVRLRLARGFSARSDWRYCLYQGEIYQLDREGYSDDEIIAKINELKPNA